MKKLFAIILTVALLLGLSVPTFAADSQTSTITVVMKDSGGDGWEEGDFGFVSLSTDKLVLGDSSGTPIKGITEFFILEDGTTATITHTVAKDEAVYFRWGGEGDEEASFNIYRDGILQYSCDDVTKFDGSVWELFFTSYPVEGTTITYTVNPTYTVTIPTNVTIDGNSTTISAENVVVEKGKYVSVSLADNNNFTVSTPEGAILDYTVTANGENVAAGGEILAVNPTDGSTEVSFNVDPTYTVTIPATVELQKVDTEGVITYENDYTLTAEAGVRLKKNEYIEVTVASDFIMTTTEGATLAYTITAGGNAVSGGGVVAEFDTDKLEQAATIHIAAADPDYAGEYKDTVTFTVAVKTN